MSELLAAFSGPIAVLLGGLILIFLVYLCYQTITIPWKIDKANKLLGEILAEMQRGKGAKQESSVRYMAGE